jgi:hypothetical protein
MSLIAERFRAAADYVNEDRRRFSFLNGARCSVGLVARFVLELSEEVVGEAFYHDSNPKWSSWREALETAYHDDQIPHDGPASASIAARLYAAGLPPDELRELEDLQAPEVRKRAVELDPCRQPIIHSDAHSFVRYMRAWADLIDEREVAEAVL